MGPMQVENLGGKIYLFVFVDDYSIYTWVKFIREKYDTFVVLKLFAIIYNVKRDKRLEITFTFESNMAKNLRSPTSFHSTLLERFIMSNLCPHHTSTKWDFRKEGSYLTRNSESYDPCHTSSISRLGISNQYFLSY